MPIRIITDGACLGNPGPGGWAALIIRADQVEEAGGHEPHTTNNRMELRAAIEGLRRVPADATVELTSDSQYLLRGITQWLPGWRRRGWITRNGTPVENRDLWDTLADLAGQRVHWHHVRGHTGDPENERANTIAQAYAAGKTPPPPAPQPPNAAARPVAASTRARPARITYLSLVNGELARHTSWQECQARVHGVSRARYKKCTSAEEEQATIRAWGLPADALQAL